MAGQVLYSIHSPQSRCKYHLMQVHTINLGVMIVSRNCKTKRIFVYRFLRANHLVFLFTSPFHSVTAVQLQDNNQSESVSFHEYINNLCIHVCSLVASRGHLTLENNSRVALFHKLCTPHTRFTRFWQNISKTISCAHSYSFHMISQKVYMKNGYAPNI